VEVFGIMLNNPLIRLSFQPAKSSGNRDRQTPLPVNSSRERSRIIDHTLMYHFDSKPALKKEGEKEGALNDNPFIHLHVIGRDSCLNKSDLNRSEGSDSSVETGSESFVDSGTVTPPRSDLCLSRLIQCIRSQSASCSIDQIASVSSRLTTLDFLKLLVVAVIQDKAPIVEYLKTCVDIDSADSQGKTVCMDAYHRGNDLLVKQLLKYGATKPNPYQSG